MLKVLAINYLLLILLSDAFQYRKLRLSFSVKRQHPFQPVIPCFLSKFIESRDEVEYDSKCGISMIFKNIYYS